MRLARGPDARDAWSSPAATEQAEEHPRPLTGCASGIVSELVRRYRCIATQASTAVCAACSQFAVVVHRSSQSGRPEQRCTHLVGGFGTVAQKACSAAAYPSQPPPGSAVEAGGAAGPPPLQ
mgnify:CR=1 FL=1